MLKYAPAVFAVGKSYQIMVPVTEESILRIKVGNEYFCDERDGVMRTRCAVHRVNVPAELLDRKKKYTVCVRKMIKRGYFNSVTEDEIETEYTFAPIPNDNIRIYHLADAHHMVDEPVAAAEKFGNIDMLIMNGDILHNSCDITDFENIYKIAERITHGNKPIIFTRGNHEIRGKYAEDFADYSPCCNGESYYTVRIGNVWAIVLNYGEIRADALEAHGHIIASEVLRRRQTEFIKEVIKNEDTEYAAAGIKHKLLICHVPFTIRFDGDCDIENELLCEWTKLLRENVKPGLMLSGHLHKMTGIYPVGCEKDNRGQPCLLVIGSGKGTDENNKNEFNVGCGITLHNTNEPEIEFFDSRNDV